MFRKALLLSVAILSGLSFSIADAAEASSKSSTASQQAKSSSGKATDSRKEKGSGTAIAQAGAAQPARASMPITPESLIPLVAAQNARAQYEALEKEIAQTRVNSERAIFEPQLTVEYVRAKTHVQNEAPQAITYSTDVFNEKSDSVRAGLEGLLPTGAQWKAGPRLVRREGNIIERRNPGEPEYRAIMELSFRQPLMRGFGSDMTLAKARMAEADQEITFQRYRLRMMELAGEALVAYWDLYRAERLLETQTESLRVAERLHRSVENLVSGGKLPSAKALEARAGVAERRSRLIQAQRAVTETKTRLWDLAGTPQDAGPGGRAFVTARTPTNSATRHVDYENSLARAHQNWPEHLLLDHKIRREGIQVDYAQDQLRPDLSVIASYGTSGLGTQAGSAQRTAFSNDFKTWFVGLEMRMPLYGGESAKNQLQGARLRKQQAELERTSVRSTLASSILTKVDMVRSLQEQLKENREDRLLNKELLDGVLERFEAGHADLREILDREENLNEAKRNELRTIVELEKALAILELAEGVLLDKYEVHVRMAPEAQQQQ